jgi:hypothetical protein
LLAERLGALSGVVAVGLIIAYITLSEPSGAPEEPAAVLAEAMANDRDTLQLAAYLGLAAAFALVWFVGYLRGHLERAEGQGGWLASVAAGGGLATMVLLLVSVSFTLAESVLAAYGADTQVAKTYLIYHWDFAPVLAPGMGALVAASTLVGFRYQGFPRWLNGVGAAIVALMVVLAPVAPGLGAAVASLWIVLASVVLALQAGRTTHVGQRS